MMICCHCGRIADRVAKLTTEGLQCRFCQAELEGRCLYCGYPGETWPTLESRYTPIGPPECRNHQS
jgi:hypothetical protein